MGIATISPCKLLIGKGLAADSCKERGYEYRGCRAFWKWLCLQQDLQRPVYVPEESRHLPVLTESSDILVGVFVCPEVLVQSDGAEKRVVGEQLFFGARVWLLNREGACVSVL